MPTSRRPTEQARLKEVPARSSSQRAATPREATPVNSGAGRRGEGAADPLRAAVAKQRDELRGLRAEVVACREEINALCGCLVDAKIIQPGSVRNQIGRGKIRGVPKMLPVFCASSATGTAGSYDVDLQVGLYAGPQALRAAGQASKVAGAASRNAWPSAVKLWPRHLFALGGTSAQGPSHKSGERFNTNTGVWEFVPEMKEPRACACGSLLGRKLYVCGGFFDDDENGNDDDDDKVADSVECLDLQGGSDWEVAPPLLSKRWGAVSGVVAGKLYVCGGYDSFRNTLRSVECFDPNRKAWAEAPPMMKQRARAASAVSGGRLYVCGGFDGSTLLASVEYFDPSAGDWQPVPPMTLARYIACGASVGGKVYVCGGVATDGQPMTSAECFDPGTWAWEALAPMSVARYGASAASAEGQLYVFGGHGLKLRLSSVERYDSKTGAWEPLLPMMMRRSGAVAISTLAQSG